MIANSKDWDALRLQMGIITVEAYIKRNPNTTLSKLLKSEGKEGYLK